MENKKKLNVNWNDMGIIITLIVMIVFFSVLTKSFFSVRNFTNIARQISVTGICAVGMTSVLLTGGIDLSIGSVIGVSSALAAIMMSYGMPVFAAVIAAFASGIAIGVVNAFSITTLHIPAMITTLATQMALRGVVYLVTGGMPVYGIPEGFKVLGQGSIGPLPISAIIMVIVFILGGVMLSRTTFGRHIYGIGGNVETARLSGVDVRKELFKVYMLEGTLGAMAGLILTSRINSGQPSSGDGYEMDIITAVVLGGVSLSGGEGKLGKVIIGIIFMGVLANGMMMMNVNEYWQRVVKGLVLLAAVAIDIRAKNKMKSI
ncbi:MAG: ABC transporter permease [Lachnospiraceae bacterium]|nr:ABC transporter permease [Lachnospiraceae bacterium]